MKYTPPQDSLSKRLREMPPRTTFLLKGANVSSVQSNVGRVQRLFRDRTYRTQKVNGGIQVWRDV